MFVPTNDVVLLTEIDCEPLLRAPLAPSTELFS